MGLCASRFGTWPQNVRARVERTGVGVGAGSDQARGGKHGGLGKAAHIYRALLGEYRRGSRRVKLDKMTSAIYPTSVLFGNPRIMHPHPHLFFEDTPSGGPRRGASQGRHPQQSHPGMCNYVIIA